MIIAQNVLHLQAGIFMKKALHKQERAFLFEKNGKIYPEETCIGEIVAAINRGIKGEWGDSTAQSIILRQLYGWICRYNEEGTTEGFLDELNSHLRQVHFSSYVVPPDFYSSGSEVPQSVYVVNMNFDYAPEVFAAKEFSRFVAYGLLDQIRRCQLPGCESIFLGRPQAKWCSKTCGSKYRVNKKRKRDLF